MKVRFKKRVRHCWISSGDGEFDVTALFSWRKNGDTVYAFGTNGQRMSEVLSGVDRETFENVADRLLEAAENADIVFSRGEVHDSDLIGLSSSAIARMAADGCIEVLE